MLRAEKFLRFFPQKVFVSSQTKALEKKQIDRGVRPKVETMP
ncbi:hypothetical protein LEP1GSC161_0802 [Leptospira santarosai str. CBC1416]|uniref:Uncharacterized protein n=2 Tax=Leptospira santarosai TaxID=28183 RepID=A0A0E2BEC4_9LEPT|nr:hypothetical protein LEP1GSC179_2578 [Leptospira santarosai str. MOR084]EKR92313.1 hypothetical protein LEP1GSC163_2648 [Leptospira santarosai str. CBC379]EMJ47607.1 hypothetical protein LEP1GSC169_2057 [Leptospira santarosai str. HAI1349]EMM76130.1 hypothetical protein LEP1GSC040_3889 [Leptospira santarosai str. 2000030832]EMO15746.1 hypothetical protein LEP1GSC165_0646 [Leptospira santarosai str. CBC523]EMO21662.1 hypothetical protein LEP1GSC168_1431 [Leptospira santarosai str. HAI134]EM